MDYCIVLLLLTFSVTDLQVASADGDGHFVNAWAAEIPGGEELARDVAEQHGYNLVRSVTMSSFTVLVLSRSVSLTSVFSLCLVKQAIFYMFVSHTTKNGVLQT